MRCKNCSSSPQLIKNQPTECADSLGKRKVLHFKGGESYDVNSHHHCAQTSHVSQNKCIKFGLSLDGDSRYCCVIKVLLRGAKATDSMMIKVSALIEMQTLNTLEERINPQTWYRRSNNAHLIDGPKLSFDISFYCRYWLICVSDKVKVQSQKWQKDIFSGLLYFWKAFF